MRLWSINPCYLDSKGLVALWREGLLAQNVLLGKTTGYRNHPQLIRFRNTRNSEVVIANYLWHIVEEAERRSYNFDKKKLPKKRECEKIKVSEGQLKYEFSHLLRKLKIRNPKRYHELQCRNNIEAHPLFIVVDGDIEDWEVGYLATQC